MNIYNLFYTILSNNELVEAEIHNRTYVLDYSFCQTEKNQIDPNPIQISQIPITEVLKQHLQEIYSQVNKISLWWKIETPILKDAFNANDWLKSNYNLDQYGFEKISEELSGAINIVRPAEIFDTKQYDYLKKGDVQYLPFDLHFDLIICFKYEGKEVEDRLYIFNTSDSDKIIDMKIGCKEYLELAYKAKILYYWQYAYLFKESQHNTRLLKMLPTIFEFIELDLSGFK